MSTDLDELIEQQLRAILEDPLYDVIQAVDEPIPQEVKNRLLKTLLSKKEYIPIERMIHSSTSFNILLSNKCCSCCSTNVEQCIM